MIFRGTAALEVWAKQSAADIVKVTNMGEDWRDGRAFLALLHHHRPDLVDVENLQEGDALVNCSKAFNIAEEKLGVSPLLDPEDMASTPQVDRLSVLTYLSSLYHALEGNSPEKETKEQWGPPRDLSKEEECLDLGQSLEEESVCSSCSSSSGYASPVRKGKKEQVNLGLMKEAEIGLNEGSVEVPEKTKVKEAKEKLEKTMRRAGAEARRESRRLVKSLCEESTPAMMALKNSRLCDFGERETPFEEALRKFSTLALSQTTIPLVRGSAYDVGGQQPMVRNTVEENEVTGSFSQEGQTCHQVETASSSLTSRATQTQADNRQTAAVQTTSNINPIDQNDVTKIVLEKSGSYVTNHCSVPKTLKTHHRRTSVHSHQHAFQVVPQTQPYNLMPKKAHFTGATKADYHRTSQLQDLHSLHLSTQVSTQQELSLPGLAVLPEYKRDTRRSLRSNLRSAKSTPHLYHQSKVYHQPMNTLVDIHQPHLGVNNNRMGPVHVQQLHGLPLAQTFSTLV